MYHTLYTIEDKQEVKEGFIQWPHVWPRSKKVSDDFDLLP